VWFKVDETDGGSCSVVCCVISSVKTSGSTTRVFIRCALKAEQ
jgi:hypothetical protein